MADPLDGFEQAAAEWQDRRAKFDRTEDPAKSPAVSSKRRGRVAWRPFWVSLFLCLFAWWQLSLLPLWKPIYIRNECEAPALVVWLILNVPTWIPVVIAIPYAFVAGLVPWRFLRGLLVAAALLGALFCHLGNVMLILKLNRNVTDPVRAAVHP